MKEPGQLHWELSSQLMGSDWALLPAVIKDDSARVESAIRADEAAKVREECARWESGRFAVFAFNSRDAAGGMGDLKSRHATLEDAQAAASKIKGFDYVEVEDLLPPGPPMVVDALESGLSTEKMP